MGCQNGNELFPCVDVSDLSTSIVLSTCSSEDSCEYKAFVIYTDKVECTYYYYEGSTFGDVTSYFSKNNYNGSNYLCDEDSKFTIF